MGLGLLMASCSEEHSGWADPQANEQGAPSSVTLAIANADAINFGTLETDSVQIFKPTVTHVNATSTSTYKVKVYNADKTSGVELNADEAGKVASGEFKAAVEKLYGKAPANRSVAMDITGFAATSNSLTVKNTGTATASVTVVAPFIDKAYYLVVDMFGEWKKENAKALTHIGTGDVYDNPEFYIVFKTTADNQFWKLISNTNYEGDLWANGETGVVGVATDGDDALTGNLTTTNPGAGKIAKAGYHKLTINMMNYTYTIEDLNFSEYIYEAGNNTGWQAHPQAMYGPNFDGKYYGAFYLDGEFKFKPNPGGDWEGDWEYTGEGHLDVNGTSNIPAPTPGFYNITVDLQNMTYTLKPFQEMRVVGDATPGGWNDGDAMTWNATDKTWVLKGVTLKNGLIKFRSDAAWDNVNLGGSLEKLVQNSNDNISVTAGKYDIVLHLENEDRAPYAELKPAN